MKIQVCAGCKSHEEIAAAVRDACRQYGVRANIEYVECLDQCHYPPVVQVDDQVITWADAAKVRDTLARAMNSKGASADG
jgi:NADH:ubiquinone oxidoreductase subunit E